MRLNRIHLPILAALLVGASFLLYRPVADHGFLYDDYLYVTRNAPVLRGITSDGLRWAFTTFTQCNWHPLTWISHMLDVQLFGVAPRGHHLVNVALHGLNAALLLAVLRRLTGAFWPSVAVAALFAAHPLNVESVAWVAERKNVLSTTLLLLALQAYAGYARRPGPARYLATALCLALGLLAKPMLVTLPFAMLLLDFWPLGRLHAGRTAPGSGTPWRRGAALVREKLPLLALALASSIVTYRAQLAGRAVRSMELYDLASRAENALRAYVLYLLKALWPSGLAVFYPFPPAGVGTGTALLCAGALAVVTALALAAGRRHPHLPVGWLWYLGTLVPVIGLVQVGDQAMADRYAYVPLVGVLVALCWGIGGVAGRLRPGRAHLAAAGAVALVCFGAASRSQMAHWKDMVTLFGHALQVTENNSMSNYHLAVGYSEQGDAARAMAHFGEALRLFPEDDEAHVNLGVLLLAAGRTDEGLWHFQQAVRWNPGSWNAHYNLGVAYQRKGDWTRAEESYRRSLAIHDGEPNTHYNLGILLLQTGRYAEAAQRFQDALSLQPDLAEARVNLRRALARGASRAVLPPAAPGSPGTGPTGVR